MHVTVDVYISGYAFNSLVDRATWYFYSIWEPFRQKSPNFFWDALWSRLLRLAIKHSSAVHSGHQLLERRNFCTSWDAEREGSAADMLRITRPPAYYGIGQKYGVLRNISMGISSSYVVVGRPIGAQKLLWWMTKYVGHTTK